MLRYSAFYGPGTSLAPGGYVVEAVRKRRLPIIGGGTGVWSSNAKAKRLLGWQPTYSSWRDGFRRGLGPTSAGYAAIARGRVSNASASISPADFTG